MHLHLRMLMHMEDVQTIESVRAELSARGISVARLCRRADIAESTWHRWTLGGVEPRSAKWQTLVKAMRELSAEYDAQAAA